MSLKVATKQPQQEAVGQQPCRGHSADSMSSRNCAQVHPSRNDTEDCWLAIGQYDLGSDRWCVFPGGRAQGVAKGVRVSKDL